ncbi:MAG: glycosyltransferase family 2 protein [Lachnospiraceae bacterium]|nr:glycosyltransferase family 2 protein [Lachnospiraceae bacterium]
MKLLSIGVPCYNSAEYMEKCVRSLLPGGDRVEIIIVDDGSTDRTGEIADTFAAEYPDIVRVIHQPNGGHGAAVMSAMRAAAGEYFKVVDSDDYVRPEAYRRILAALTSFAETEEKPDMLISNYVYNKAGEKRHRVMHYSRVIPQERILTWDEIGRLKKGMYILMHSVIYRTQLLRECGLELPEHTFYVDNLYVFEPLPYVKTLYYLNVNFYSYNIGREDQSVNERVMVSRVDQQLRVNRMMIDYMAAKKELIRRQDTCYHYMLNYLEIICGVSTVLLFLDGSPEKIAEKEKLWDYLKERDPEDYKILRRGIIGNLAHLPGKGGRKVGITFYRILDSIFHFN